MRSKVVNSQRSVVSAATQTSIVHRLTSTLRQLALAAIALAAGGAWAAAEDNLVYGVSFDRRNAYGDLKSINFNSSGVAFSNQVDRSNIVVSKSGMGLDLSKYKNANPAVDYPIGDKGSNSAIDDNTKSAIAVSLYAKLTSTPKAILWHLATYNTTQGVMLRQGATAGSLVAAWWKDSEEGVNTWTEADIKAKIPDYNYADYHHIVLMARKTDKSYSLYIDGVQIASGNNSSRAYVHDNGVRGFALGCKANNRQTAASVHAQGDAIIDDFRIYACDEGNSTDGYVYPLTAEEISTIYASFNTTVANTYTWTGGASGDWTEPTNWSKGGAALTASDTAPTLGTDRIAISTDATISMPTETSYYASSDVSYTDDNLFIDSDVIFLYNYSGSDYVKFGDKSIDMDITLKNTGTKAIKVQSTSSSASYYSGLGVVTIKDSTLLSEPGNSTGIIYLQHKIVLDNGTFQNHSGKFYTWLQGGLELKDGTENTLNQTGSQRTHIASAITGSGKLNVNANKGVVYMENSSSSAADYAGTIIISTTDGGNTGFYMSNYGFDWSKSRTEMYLTGKLPSSSEVYGWPWRTKDKTFKYGTLNACVQPASKNNYDYSANTLEIGYIDEPSALYGSFSTTYNGYTVKWVAENSMFFCGVTNLAKFVSTNGGAVFFPTDKTVPTTIDFEKSGTIYATSSAKSAVETAVANSTVAPTIVEVEEITTAATEVSDTTKPLYFNGGSVKIKTCSAKDGDTVATFTGTIIGTPSFVIYSPNTGAASLFYDAEYSTEDGTTTVKAKYKSTAFIWTGATDNKFADKNNWTVNGEIPSEYPKATGNAAIVNKEVEFADSSNVDARNILILEDVSFASGGYLNVYGGSIVEGTGVLTTSKSIRQANNLATDYYVDVKIQNNNQSIYGSANTAKINFYGKVIVDSGKTVKITDASSDDQFAIVTFYGDMSEFKGVMTNTFNHAENSYLQFGAPMTFGGSLTLGTNRDTTKLLFTAAGAYSFAYLSGTGIVGTEGVNLTVNGGNSTFTSHCATYTVNDGTITVPTDGYSESMLGTDTRVLSSDASTTVLASTKLTWKGSAGGSWSTASNWNYNETPTASTVCILPAGSSIVIDENFAASSVVLGDGVTLSFETIAAAQSFAADNASKLSGSKPTYAITGSNNAIELGATISGDWNFSASGAKITIETCSSVNGATVATFTGTVTGLTAAKVAINSPNTHEASKFYDAAVETDDITGYTHVKVNFKSGAYVWAGNENDPWSDSNNARWYDGSGSAESPNKNTPSASTACIIPVDAKIRGGKFNTGSILLLGNLTLEETSTSDNVSKYGDNNLTFTTAIIEGSGKIVASGLKCFRMATANTMLDIYSPIQLDSDLAFFVHNTNAKAVLHGAITGDKSITFQDVNKSSTTTKGCAVVFDCDLSGFTGNIETPSKNGESDSPSFYSDSSYIAFAKPGTIGAKVTINRNSDSQALCTAAGTYSFASLSGKVIGGTEAVTIVTGSGEASTDEKTITYTAGSGNWGLQKEGPGQLIVASADFSSYKLNGGTLVAVGQQTVGTTITTDTPSTIVSSSESPWTYSLSLAIGAVTFDYYSAYTAAKTVTANVTGIVADNTTWTLTIDGVTTTGTYNSDANTVTFSNVPVTLGEQSYTITATGGSSTSKNGNATAGAASSGWISSNSSATSGGSWDPELSWTDTTASISSGSTFSATTASSGELVIITTVVCFTGAADDEVSISGAQAALKIADESGLVFKALTDSAAGTWSTAYGVTPNGETTYTVVIKIDYTRGKYSIKVGDVQLTTTNGGTDTWFNLASAATNVSSIEYKGSCVFTSLAGTYAESPAISETVDAGNVTVSKSFVNSYLSDKTVSEATALLSPSSETKADNGYNYFANYALGLVPDGENKTEPTVNVTTDANGKFVLTLTDSEGNIIIPAAGVGVSLSVLAGSTPESLVATEAESTEGSGATQSFTINPTDVDSVKYYKVQIGIGASN